MRVGLPSLSGKTRPSPRRCSFARNSAVWGSEVRQEAQSPSKLRLPGVLSLCGPDLRSVYGSCDICHTPDLIVGGVPSVAFMSVAHNEVFC